MDTTHRKIELQSPADLAYLVNNASRCARERIDIHFPPSANSDHGNLDASSNSAQNKSTISTVSGKGSNDTQPSQEVDMRRRVEELVAAYLEGTYSGVRANVSVNGLEGRELEGMTGESEGMAGTSIPRHHSRKLYASCEARYIRDKSLTDPPMNRARTIRSPPRAPNPSRLIPDRSADARAGQPTAFGSRRGRNELSTAIRS